ncbi:MAG: YcaO-like family protein [Pilosibacter sp.]
MENWRNAIFMHMYRLGRKIHGTNLDCKISQEEKNVSMDIAENLIKNYFSLIGKDSNTYNKFISQIMRFSQLKGNSKYQKTILFKNASDNTKLWLPIDFLDLLYGTNGMAAGNTIEEAMVQGLSEILERYVIRQCILKRLSPPELSQNLFNSLDNNKQILESINAIEHSGRYSVKVRDLSLGAKIPAIGIILYDKVNRGYLVKVGVHPKLEIALERCFTELLQGHTIDNYRNIMLVRNCTKNPGDINNICRFYVDSHAHIPIEFFINEQVSYMPLTENNSFNNNIEMYKYLSEIIHQLGYEIFVHDYSKISIYSVQILVPGLSEYGAINDAYLDKVNEQYEVSRILLGGMKNYTYEQIKFLITFINKYIKSQNGTNS